MLSYFHSLLLLFIMRLTMFVNSSTNSSYRYHSAYRRLAPIAVVWQDKWGVGNGRGIQCELRIDSGHPNEASRFFRELSRPKWQKPCLKYGPPLNFRPRIAISVTDLSGQRSMISESLFLITLDSIWVRKMKGKEKEVRLWHWDSRQGRARSVASAAVIRSCMRWKTKQRQQTVR
jgi:hypothetical protein